MSSNHVSRPPVSIVAPFYGRLEQARLLVDRFDRLKLIEGDEILLADNTPGGIIAQALQPDSQVQVVEAWSRASPYTARNAGAAVARNDWLLFLDGDVDPRPDLLDVYFTQPPAERNGIVAGRVLDQPGQDGIVPAYVRSRGYYDQERCVAHPYGPVVLVGNMLVRREAFDAVGGFCDGVRSGADSDFSWRVHGEGWGVRYEAEAWVIHEHRSSIKAVAKQSARDGAGKHWLERRLPGSALWPGPMKLVRCIVAIPVWIVLLQPRKAAFKVIDIAAIFGERLGQLADNAAADRATKPVDSIVLAATFPGDGLPDVLAYVAAHDGRVRVEAADRPIILDPRAQAVDSAYQEEDGIVHRWRSLGRIAVRSPLRCLRYARAAGWGALWRAAPSVTRIQRHPGVDVRLAAGAPAGLPALIGVPAGPLQAQSTKVR